MLLARFGLIFLVLPLIELYLLIKLGQQIGALATVAWVVLAIVAGISLLQFELRRVSVQLQMAARNRELPAGHVSDAAAIFLAGVLLIFPGPLTDVFAALLLFPLTRRPMVKLFNYWVWPQRSTVFRSAGGAFGGSGFQVYQSTVWQAGPRMTDASDFQGQGVEQPRLHPHPAAAHERSSASSSGPEIIEAEWVRKSGEES